MKILIVEADPAAAAWLQAAVQEQGHVTRQVASGTQALMAALAEEYDLLICDMQLPDLHGTELVRALKAQSPLLPVMAIGDGDLQSWDQSCKDCGASCYLQKPLLLEDLRQEVVLVNKARLHLHTVLVDPDPIHRTHVTKGLNSLGCVVVALGSAAEIGKVELRAGTLVLVDAAMDGAIETVRFAKSQGATCFVFKERFDATTEEMLMRAGAAYLLEKPINIEQLLTQAAFMAA